VNRAVEELIHSPDNLPGEEGEIKTAIHQITGLQQQHVESGEFPEAQHLQRILNSLNSKLKLISNKRRGVGDAKDVVYKKKELEAIVDRIIYEWNDAYREFLSISQQEAEALRARHREELEAFDGHTPVSVPNRNRAHSSLLIELRDKEQALARNGKLTAAQKVRDQADQIESEEAHKQVGRMYQDIGRHRKQLIARQRKEMRIFMEHMEMTRKKMIQERDRMLEGYLIRMEKVDRDLYRFRDEVQDYPLCERRERVVTKGEFSYPIPRMRPAAAFMAARQCSSRVDTSAGSRASSAKSVRVARIPA
jgi:hypothetical protein